MIDEKTVKKIEDSIANILEHDLPQYVGEDAYKEMDKGWLDHILKYPQRLIFDAIEASRRRQEWRTEVAPNAYEDPMPLDKWEKTVLIFMRSSVWKVLGAEGEALILDATAIERRLVELLFAVRGLRALIAAYPED